MNPEWYLGIVLFLMAVAVLDLIVGVSNDAVNFLNSAIGSRVASRKTIFLIASCGLFAGVLFSSGMMEVARKGIFNPQFFTMPDLMMVFFAVMIADLIILDLFNTYGLPTSTTVSIVFELLGAAVFIALLKVLSEGRDIGAIGEYINSAKALGIISGILLSVVIAFVFGALAQFCARLLFTFHYEKYLPLFGGIWGGLCLSAISIFILLKGAKGATFITAEMAAYIKENLFSIALTILVVSGALFQLMISLFRVNVFKPIVLIGTFSLALAFAANDLVNFVGVPIASLHAYNAAMATASPLSVPMDMLAGKVPSALGLLLFSGVVMVLALWFSRKAKSVTETEIQLSSHDDATERFESLALSRVIVRMFMRVFAGTRALIPRRLRKFTRKRFARHEIERRGEFEHLPSFDLVRASTNLMMASILVSFATSLKLPLSTTYVTFMVAMGTSFADQAWGRDSAVYRVTGVLTVIGGWFMTALMAFLTAGTFVSIVFLGGWLGGVALLAFAAVLLWRAHGTHRERMALEEQEEVFNLKKIGNAEESARVTLHQTGTFLRLLRSHLDATFQSLFDSDRIELRNHYQARKQVQRWSSILSANVFKVMRLAYEQESVRNGNYSQTVLSLQSLAEGYRDIVTRSYLHVRENHKGLLSVQRSELAEVITQLLSLLEQVEADLLSGASTSSEGDLFALNEALAAEINRLLELQAERIHNRSSKTRLSILYFALLEDIARLAEQSVRLFRISKNLLPEHHTRALKER
jgi:phosphate/sulfate permease